MAVNRSPRRPADVPNVIPVFPLPEALLLPRGELPLSIFEPRYVAMVDDALAGDRVIGMVQPRPGEETDPPRLSDVGCLGRITSFQETDDGRYLITLTGVCRFRVQEEVDTGTPYRQCRISIADFVDDLEPRHGEEGVDRTRLLSTFRAYLDANGLETDWDAIKRASTETLVNALSMMSPYGVREKQALLEAQDLSTRAEVLIAVTEMALARGDDDSGSSLQ
ncbi:LON peptidase substrate-binding domain-containing protein [Lutibaculum baratangense]|uniref:LON peptidase substrate-binding domain-containing protein n=1 Tax=Lutibaculum baratangense TaxID=1358440 RepID=UPI00058E5188|nr:LON peptidase substrate-binding domain-containing protein [Lutibaculum baratangense]